MRSVLISIRPKWCQKIMNSEKTIEIRKTRPKLGPPFRCYIYCTQPKYPHEDFLATDYPKPQFYGGGKVIGEFTCARIDTLARIGYTGSHEKPRYHVCTYDFLTKLATQEFVNACLSEAESEEYLQGRIGYGWHISDLVIYDEPHKLNRFRRVCPESLYCESCAMHCERTGRCGNAALYLHRAPQSWCYVEEEEN